MDLDAEFERLSKNGGTWEEWNDLGNAYMAENNVARADKCWKKAVELMKEV